MVQPITQVLLTIPKALQDELITDSGLKLYIAPDFKKEWQASVTAIVAALPSNPHHKHKKIVSQLKVGDKICISYDVVANFDFTRDSDRFMQATEDNPHIKEFYNGKGETVRVYAMAKRAGFAGVIWIGVHLDSRRELIDGVQGDESTLERWLSQFPFGKTDSYQFNNFFEYEGNDYWKCDPDQIFAVKRKGHLVAVGDRIITKPVDEEVPDQFLINDNGLAEKVVIRHADRGRVITGGKEKGIKKEDIINFEPQFVEKYDFFGQQYFLIKENFVLGKWN